MLELRHLQVLHALSIEGTVTGAAKRLGFSASAVSQQLAALSRLLGQPVTRKQGRLIVLTAAGATLAARASDILASVALAESVARATGRTEGSLAVAAFPSAARQLLVPAMTRLAKDIPSMQIRLVEAEPERALPLLQLGKVDLALIYTYDLLPFASEAVTLFPLADERMWFVCSAATAESLHGGQTASVAELRTLPWIAGPDESRDHEVTRRICGALGFEPHIVHSAEDYTLSLELAAAGLGVGFIPLDAVPEVPDGIRAIALPGVEPVRHVWAAARNDHDTRPANAALLAALRDSVGARLRATESTITRS